MKQRLQKIISASGYCSRRAAETLIEEGRVTVNGITAALGDSAEETGIISIDSVPLVESGVRTYIMLNKPRGYVTTMRDDKGRKTVAQLTADVGVRVYPVGRLDMESEGLLIMTDDGDFANRLMHPSHNVEKVYDVRVKGQDPDKAIQALCAVSEIDGKPIAPAKVSMKSIDGDCALISITIHEGRNRQVRKMCEQAGLTVLRLKRVAEGNLRLNGLPSGKWRTLRQEEIDNLQ